MDEFQVDIDFEQLESSGGLKLGSLERYYKRLMNEMLSDGVISDAERDRLGEVAESLDLDAARVAELEAALIADYRARHSADVEFRSTSANDPYARAAAELAAEDAAADADAAAEESAIAAAVTAAAAARPNPKVQATGADESVAVTHDARSAFMSGAKVVAADGDADAVWESAVLSRRVEELEELVGDLRRELGDSRARGGVTVDLAEMNPHAHERPPASTTHYGAQVGSQTQAGPEALFAKVERDPRDVDTLRALFDSIADNDRRWCVAQALVLLGDSVPRVVDYYRSGVDEGVIHPHSSLDSSTWSRLLQHPYEDPLTGEIFSLIVEPVLLGHVSAKRRAGTLPDLVPGRWLNPETDPHPAVRSFAWAAKVLGTKAPLLYRDVDYQGVAWLAPGVPPALRLGNALMDEPRTVHENAFVAGRWLAAIRRERFMHLLFPDVTDLKSLFLAALTIGRPDMPLKNEVRERVTRLANAIRRFLDEETLAHLRAAFERFSYGDGRTDLHHWAFAAECSAARAGLLLCNDLQAAVKMLQLSEAPRLTDLVDDLIVYCCSEHYSALRSFIGVTS